MSGVKGAALPRRSDTLDAGGLYSLTAPGLAFASPGCLTASAGFGAAPQGPGTANCRRSTLRVSCHLNDSCTSEAA